MFFGHFQGLDDFGPCAAYRRQRQLPHQQEYVRHSEYVVSKKQFFARWWALPMKILIFAEFFLQGTITGRDDHSTSSSQPASYVVAQT